MGSVVRRNAEETRTGGKVLAYEGREYVYVTR